MGAITHPFVSAVADGGDASLVQPSNWNAAHSLTGIAQTDTINTFALTQTFTVAPIFTDASGTRTALGLGTLATQSGTFSGTSSGTNTGDQTITLTGDVTGSGTGSFAATLATTQGAVHTWSLVQTFGAGVQSSAGVAMSATAQAPAAITTAQAGVAASITASAAVAGSSVAGAAAGGSATITAGNAARLTSGNANGGDVILQGGTGIGTGVGGKLVARVSGGGGTTGVSFDVSGSQNLAVKCSDGATVLNISANGFYGNNTGKFFIGDNAGLLLSSDFPIKWSSTTAYGGTTDTGMARNAAGVVEVNNGTSATYRDLKLRNLLCGGGNGSYVQTPSMTVANLAVASTAGLGALATVSDATATTRLSTVAGGGANKVVVFSDGTNWLIL